MLRNLLKNVRRPVINFVSYRKPRKPNIYVLAPEGLCQFTPHMISPEFDLPVTELIAHFEEIFFSMPNTEFLTERLTGENGQDIQKEYVHYSRLIGFPDTITVRFMSLAEGRSSIALISRSHYGYRDLGVNKGRVYYLMQKLAEKLGIKE